jgi:endonuclease/exonuclease/phosphatase family metal-dependent hydrolase
LNIDNPKMYLRVLTFNIHNGINWNGKYDLDGIAGFIKEVRPDFGGIQEVSCCWSPKTGFQNMEKFFAKKLGMYTIFSATLKKSSKGHFGNMVISSHPCVNVWTERLPGKFEPRNFITVQVQINGVRINFLTTHLGLTSAERLPQIEKIIRFGIQLGNPLIITGDFNEKETDPGVTHLKKYWIKQSASLRSGTFRLRKNFIGPEIDMIFTTSDFILENIKICPNYLSDHLPVIADLELRTSWAARTGTSVYQ